MEVKLRPTERAGMVPTPVSPDTVIAAILYERGEPIENFMAAAAKTFNDRAIRVGGLVQHNRRTGENARCLIELENIATGLRYRLTQNLGPASQSCALDISALADASAVLRQAIADRVEIVIVNKFGAQEASGGGLRDEMMQIALAGIPMLTAVGRRYLADWQEFVGAEAVLLPMSVPEVLSWWDGFCISSVDQSRRIQTVRASV